MRTAPRWWGPGDVAISRSRVSYTRRYLIFIVTFVDAPRRDRERVWGWANRHLSKRDLGEVHGELCSIMYLFYFFYYYCLIEIQLEYFWSASFERDLCRVNVVNIDHPDLCMFRVKIVVSEESHHIGRKCKHIEVASWILNDIKPSLIKGSGRSRHNGRCGQT